MPKYQADDFINHRYKVIRLLGQGAMGEVYLVEDMIKVDRLVALKVLNSENLDEADFWSKGEYEALTRLRHPNLARVYDFARIHDSSDFYIVSEFIHGEDLFSAIRGMNSEEVLDVIAQICRSLEYIHTQGYVHFDVKPDNILVTRQRSAGHDESSKVEWNPNVPSDSGSDLGSGPPRAKLIDFGLAEQITGTFNFAIKGTFHYVAPEIIRGQTPDKRADLYSLGVTIFQILTDYLPFVDASGATMDRSKLNWREEIRRSLGAHPSYLADILCRLLEDDPDDRFSSARAIIQALNAGSGQHFEIETAETQISYLYCSRVVGRRKELNRLREESELVFSVLPGGNRQPTGETSVVSQLLRDGRKRPPLFMLSGEIGVGKTRLIGEFKHTLKMREIPVHTGNCYETNHDAYHPFREIMEQLGLDLGLESDVFQKHKAAVCRLCPKLRSSEATEDEGAGFRPDKERLFFIDSLASFMIDAAAVKPCVFDVNNLHWADEATAELLGHLIDRIVNLEENLPTPIPLMIVGTMRSDETLPDPVRTLLSKLREDESIREMPVHRFTRPQIAELIHNMLQIEEIPTPFLDRLEERTAGNPLFIVETLKGLQEEGIIAREGDRWRVRGDGDLRRIEIPHGIEAILLRRVRMLDEQQQRVLETMSAYDKPISGRFLEHFPEFARIDVMSCLRELENRGMVVKSLDAGRVQFSIEQPKLREILYENIPDDRRQILHGVLADALFSEYGDRDDDVVEDLAYHYQRSDRVGKSLEFTLRAGDICRKVFAHDRAVTHFRHVIQQVEGHPDHTRVWYDTHEKIGDIGTLSGNFEVARSSYDTLLDVEYREPLTAADRSRVLRKRGKLDEIAGDYDRALRCYKEACDLLELGGMDPASMLVQAEQIRVYNAIGWVYVCMGKYDKAMKIAADALRKVEGLEEKGEHAMIFSTIGSANYFKGNLEQAIEFHTRALEIRENLENVPDIIISLNNLGDAHLASAEYMEALRHYTQARDAAEQISDAFGRAMALHNLAKTHIELGDDDQAESFMRSSLKLSREYEMRYLNTLNYLLRGRLRRRRDDLGKSEGDLFRALGVFAKQGTRWGLSQCLIEICELQIQRGNEEEALRMAQEAVANAVALNVPVLEARTRLLELSALRSIGKTDDQDLIDRLSIIARSVEGVKNVEIHGRIELERAEIFVSQRDLDAAREAYGRADEHFREIADKLPPDFRESYLAVRHVTAPDAGPQADYREVPSAVEETAVERKAEPATPAIDPTQEEMLRVASLLQELNEAGSPRTFMQKVVTCVIQATRSEEGFLLLRSGDTVRVVIALDRDFGRVKSPGERLCLEALELSWDSELSIIAPRVIDHPGVHGYEALYRQNVNSLAVLPLTPGFGLCGALYLTNPAPDHLQGNAGSPALVAYQNLLQLTIPRAIPTPTTA